MEDFVKWLTGGKKKPAAGDGMPPDGKGRAQPSAASFKVGAIALAFLILGYQAALVVTRAGRLLLEANRDRPDTVYIYQNGAGPSGDAPRGSFSSQGGGAAGSSRGAGGGFVSPGTGGRPPEASGDAPVPGNRPAAVRRNAPHSSYVQEYRRQTRRVESFRFNPNTVTVEDLIRLGFSEKQAQAIDNYREKGGRFRRKADFAESFVVADSVYRRLERFIDIPRLDLNRADSAALDALPGIGPWFAGRILSYRAELGGYSFPEQLMDIYRFDREKYDALSDLVFCSSPAPYALWSLPADSLRLHPYIRSWQAARAIVLFREHTPRDGWTVAALGEAGILPPEDAARLARCAIAPP